LQFSYKLANEKSRGSGEANALLDTLMSLIRSLSSNGNANRPSKVSIPDNIMEQSARRSPRRISFLSEGNAETYHAFSGTAKGIVDHLRLLGENIVCVDVRPPNSVRLANALVTWSTNRRRWKAKFRHGDFAFNARSRQASCSIRKASAPFDLAFQIGATFLPPENVPYVLYCDWNMGLSIQNRATGRASTDGMTAEETHAINSRQSKIYHRAALIFTICERLRESFIQDYQIPQDRVVRAYPGVNFLDSDIKAVQAYRKSDGPPTVLFIGKEFERKGGKTLLQAFQNLRNRIPGARLVIIGAENAPKGEPGVESLGVLNKAVAGERERLLNAFAAATVFCLPSRLDPFPNVVREAMVFGLPCVTSDVWAFPEMVIHGETGFVVPPDEPVHLAARLEQLLGCRDLAMKMGAAGQRYAASEFSWTKCASTIKNAIDNRFPDHGLRN
jgi:glycosyltransferase involved in cell wall biosynthesis